MCTQNDVIQAVQSVASSFGKNELAYLALTSKAENPVRDKIAFNLYNQLYSSGFFVAREWKRRDIAVIDSQANAVSIIELKLMYTFDAVKSQTNLSGFDVDILNDVKKARAKSPNADIYVVLLATHPKSNISGGLLLSGAIKYSNGINKSIAKYSGNFSQIATEANSAVINNPIIKANSGNFISVGVINAGVAFDVDTDVMFWLIKF